MRHLYFLLILLVGGLNGPLRAQDYPSGVSRYLQNEFAAAEGIFQNVLAADMPKKQRAQILKMLGLSQYMQGKRNEAGESFKLAKKLNPSIHIKASEILDQSVLDFFNSVEGPPAGSVVDEEEAPKKKKAKRETVQYEEKKEEATTLLIISNVIEARVIVDGFFRGRVGDTIPIDPGAHSVEVYANGYQNLVQTVEINASRLNTFTFELRKFETPESQAKKEVLAPVKKEEPQEKEKEKKVVAKKKKKKKVFREYHRTAFPEEMAQGLYFIPFGVPQYLQGKNWLGVGFSLLQAAGVGFSVSRLLETNQLIDDTNSTVSQRDSEEAGITDPVKKKAFADETDLYYANQVEEINALRLQAYLGLGFFALAWLASGVEAYYNPPEAPGANLKSHELRKREKSWSWTLSPSFLPFKGRIKEYGINLAIRF